jgi:hypothetical protein
MNKHIELVKKWLADPESVSLEELEANREAAWDNWAAAAEAVKAAIAAEAAVKAAYRGGVKANKATYWRNQAIKYVKQYEELTK